MFLGPCASSYWTAISPDLRPRLAIAPVSTSSTRETSALEEAMTGAVGPSTTVNQGRVDRLTLSTRRQPAAGPKRSAMRWRPVRRGSDPHYQLCRVRDQDWLFRDGHQQAGSAAGR